jgi:RNA polymerase sigma factor (sigma-70 family)
MQQSNIQTDRVRSSATRGLATRPVTDNELIAAAINGNEFAFRQLCERHACMVARLASYFFVSQSDIIAIVQAAFGELARSLDRFGSEGPRDFAKWLAHLTISTCYIEMRRRSRVKGESVAKLDALAHREWNAFCHQHCSTTQLDNPNAPTRISREVAHKVLSQLDALDRVVMTLLTVEAWSLDELAKLTGWSSAKVSLHVQQSFAHLRSEQFRLSLCTE